MRAAAAALIILASAAQRAGATDKPATPVPPASAPAPTPPVAAATAKPATDTPPPAAAAAADTPPLVVTTPPVPPVPNVATLKPEPVINHLNAVTRWYRDAQRGEQWVRQPADEFFWHNDQTAAAEVVKSAFAWACAEAPMIPDPAPPISKNPAVKAPNRQRIAEVEATNEERIGQLQGEIKGLDQQINGKPAGEARDALIAQKGALVSALQLTQEFQDYVGKAQNLMAGAAGETAQTGLKGEISAVELSVRSAFDPESLKPAAGPSTPRSEVDSTGMIGQGTLLYALERNLHQLDTMAGDKGSIVALEAEVETLRTPVRAMLKDIVDQGQKATTDIESSDAVAFATKRHDLQLLSTNLKQLSAAALALRGELIALDQARTNLVEWRVVIERHRDVILRALGGRLLLIVVVLAILVITSELWRRATFRYVQDLRRRRQLLLLRRFAYGTLIATVLIMGLVSNLSSLATFAGFITAGIAVASQTIIVSIAAFFFMVGRNGVHVGDRVTVTSSTGAQCTGKVVEIDLVRFSIMELTGDGTELHPTGRIASYANSVLFQTVPFFKHIPGTSYGWHEIALSLTPEADYEALQKAVLKAVNEVYAESRKALEEQRGHFEREREWSLDVPEPTAQVRYGANGPELVAGFPADRTGTVGMDLRVSNAVRDVIQKDPTLQKSVNGDPQIRKPNA